MTQIDNDERLDVIQAVHLAELPPERRRFARIKRKVATQMSAWELGIEAKPFGVVIEDICEMGVGIIHDEALAVGSKYLLTVPRAESKAVLVEVRVVRCEPRNERSYSIGLESATLIENVHQTAAAMRLTSKRVRLLFLLFGVIGLILAALVPL